MLVVRLKNVFGVVVQGQKTEFGDGDYRVLVSREELAKLGRDSIHWRVLSELRSKAEFSRAEGNNHASYFRTEVDGWTPTLAAAANHSKHMSIQQLVVLHYVVRTEKFELSGQTALDYIGLLWQLTPGGGVHNSRSFPIPAEEDLPEIKLVKFFDEGFGKTSLHFTVPDGVMAGRLFGTEGANIKHLGNVLAGGANLHPHVNPIVKEVAIEEFDPQAIL